MNDRAFLRAFEAAAIPRDRWTHRAHVRMAFLYLPTIRSRRRSPGSGSVFER
jgi:hypothetical protein